MDTHFTANKGGQPLKVGVAGCGGVAQIIHLPILARMRNIDIVALCDIDTRKASILANRFKIDFIYDDIEQMLETHQLDAVFVLTPNNMHLPMCLIALENDVHVFVERPAGRNSEEAMRIAEVAKKRNRQVMVGMHSRFRPDIRALKTAVLQKTLGDVFFIRAQWLQAKFEAIKQPWLLSKRIAGGGVVMDLGVQLIDTSWWLLGKPQLSSAKASVHQIDKNVEVEDFCSLQLNFGDKATVVADLSWNFPLASDRFSAELFATIGSMRLNPFRITKLWQGREVDLTTATPRSGEALFKKAYESQIQHFADFLQGRETQLISGIDEAVEVLKIVETVYQSIEARQEILLSPSSSSRP